MQRNENVYCIPDILAVASVHNACYHTREKGKKNVYELHFPFHRIVVFLQIPANLISLRGKIILLIYISFPFFFSEDLNSSLSCLSIQWTTKDKF